MINLTCSTFLSERFLKYTLCSLILLYIALSVVDIERSGYCALQMINIIIGKYHKQIAFKPSTTTTANTRRFIASVRQLSIAVISATGVVISFVWDIGSNSTS